jgi:hypothetical protein
MGKEGQMVQTPASAPPELVEQLASAGRQRIEASHPPAVWLAAVGALAERARQASPWRKRLGWLVGGLAAADLLAHSLPAAALVTVALAAASAGYVLTRRRGAFSPRLGEVVAPLLAILREDMAPGAPVTLRLDLRGGTLDQKRVSRQVLPSPSGRGAPQITESRYEDAWLAGTAELADGSRLELAIVDQIRKRDITRRNRRGKLKTKAKYKVKACVDVQVAFPDDYAPLTAGERRDGPGRLAVLPGERRTKVKLRQTFERYHPEAPLAVRPVLDLIATAYSQVAPARAGGG